MLRGWRRGRPDNDVHGDVFREREPVYQTDGREFKGESPEEEGRGSLVVVVADEVRVGAAAGGAGLADGCFVSLLDEGDARNLGVRSETKRGTGTERT